MKLFALFSFSVLSAHAAVYPDGTLASLICASGDFDVQSSPPSPTITNSHGCVDACLTKAFDTPAALDVNGFYPGLIDVQYAGCSWPAIYGQSGSLDASNTSEIEQGDKPDGHKGYSISMPFTSLINSSNVVNASLTVVLTSDTIDDWRVFAMKNNDSILINDVVDYNKEVYAPLTVIDKSSKLYLVDLTEFYQKYYYVKYNDEQRFNLFAVAATDLIDVNKPILTYVAESSFDQFGADPSCVFGDDGTTLQTACDTCTANVNCHFCSARVLPILSDDEIDFTRCGVPSTACERIEWHMGDTYMYDHCGLNPSDPHTTPSGSMTLVSLSLAGVTIAGAISLLM